MRVHSFSDAQLARLKDACCQEPNLAALYAFDLRSKGDSDLAALFTERPDWPRRLDLELACASALDMESVEMIDLGRMSLVFRYDVINRGKLLYLGDPDILAVFVEETVVRYSAFYPLLEALYWKVETQPLAEDRPSE